jgi:hypothetical protein
MLREACVYISSIISFQWSQADVRLETTPLHLAAARGQLDHAEQLIQFQGGNVGALDEVSFSIFILR